MSSSGSVSVFVLVAMASAMGSASTSSSAQDARPAQHAGPSQHTRPAQHARPTPGDLTVHRAPRPLSPSAETSDWTRFLGPEGRGVSPETELEQSWGPQGPRLLWERVAGDGYSAPAVAADRLIYFHRIGDEEVVECLRPETGEAVWEHRYGTDYRDSYGYSSGPRCAPLIRDGHVYTYGAQGVLSCLELSTGKPVWTRELVAEFDVPQDFFGVAATPVAYGDQLIVHVGAPGGPSVIALDLKTGADRWRSKSEWLAGYSTPVIAPIHGRDRCFVFTGGKSRPPSGGLICLDPVNGEIDFEFPWRSRSYESVNAASPVVIGDGVFVSASYDTGGALLKLDAEGSYEQAWSSDALGTHFNTAIHTGGYLYGFDGRNEPDAALVCLDLATGAEVWRKVLEWEETYKLNGTVKPRSMSIYRGTLIRADGNYLCLGERGHLLWLELTPEGPRELARSWLFAAHETWAPPVVSRGLLYVTQNARDFVTGGPPRLLCYDLRRQAE